MRGRTGWAVVTDELILEELRRERIDYVALIASRRGIRYQDAERRCRELARRGLIEPVSAEVVYRLTAEGERYLDRGADLAEAGPDA